MYIRRVSWQHNYLHQLWPSSRKKSELCHQKSWTEGGSRYFISAEGSALISLQGRDFLKQQQQYGEAIRRVEPKWCWARPSYPTVALSAKDLRSHRLYILQWSSGPISESLIQCWWTAAYSTMLLAFERFDSDLPWVESQCWYLWGFFLHIHNVAPPISGLDYRQRSILICKQVASLV